MPGGLEGQPFIQATNVCFSCEVEFIKSHKACLSQAMFSLNGQWAKRSGTKFKCKLHCFNAGSLIKIAVRAEGLKELRNFGQLIIHIICTLYMSVQGTYHPVQQFDSLMDKLYQAMDTKTQYLFDGSFWSFVFFMGFGEIEKNSTKCGQFTR